MSCIVTHCHPLSPIVSHPCLTNQGWSIIKWSRFIGPPDDFILIFEIVLSNIVNQGWSIIKWPSFIGSSDDFSLIFEIVMSNFVKWWHPILWSRFHCWWRWKPAGAEGVSDLERLVINWSLNNFWNVQARAAGASEVKWAEGVSDWENIVIILSLNNFRKVQARAAGAMGGSEMSGGSEWLGIICHKLLFDQLLKRSSESGGSEWRKGMSEGSEWLRKNCHKLVSDQLLKRSRESGRSEGRKWNERREWVIERKLSIICLWSTFETFKRVRRERRRSVPLATGFSCASTSGVSVYRVCPQAVTPSRKCTFRASSKLYVCLRLCRPRSNQTRIVIGKKGNFSSTG